MNIYLCDVGGVLRIMSTEDRLKYLEAIERERLPDMLTVKHQFTTGGNVSSEEVAELNKVFYSYMLC